MGHSRFDTSRPEWINGVKYVRTIVVVVDRFPDGEPRTTRVIRDGEPHPGVDAELEIVHQPSSWSRGTGK